MMSLWRIVIYSLYVPVVSLKVYFSETHATAELYCEPALARRVFCSENQACCFEILVWAKSYISYWRCFFAILQFLHPVTLTLL